MGKKERCTCPFFFPSLILANILRLSTSSLGSSRKKKEKKERKKEKRKGKRGRENEGMEDRSIAGSTNGKEMMHHPRNEHGRPAHSYLGFLLITATPDICISPGTFLFVCACKNEASKEGSNNERSRRG